MSYIHEFPHPRVGVQFHPTHEQFTVDDVRFALDKEIHALELDLHLRRADGRIVCNHDGPTASSPALEQVIDLVLEKMGDRATLYDDGCQFFLVLEPKANSPPLFEAILEVLNRYADRLSTGVSRGDAPRGITVVITGKFALDFFARLDRIHSSPHPINGLCIVEGRDYDSEITNLAEGQPVFQWVALRSGDERSRVNDLHTGADRELEGRYNVRVWDCKPDAFSVCLATGVDQINSDREQVAALKHVIADQVPCGRYPTLALLGSQALLTWRGQRSHSLYVALGELNGSFLNFRRQIVLTHFLADECLALAPAGVLTPDGGFLVVYEGLSDRRGLRRLWHLYIERLPAKLARRLRQPQSLRYVTGRFSSLERFVTFTGQERRLTWPWGKPLRGRDPAVAIGPDGRILIAFEGAAGRGLCYFSGSLGEDGELAGRVYPLLDGDITHGYTPTIAVDQMGRVLVVYKGERDQELLYLSGGVDPSGRILGRRLSLSQRHLRRGMRPSVALNGKGRVILAYQGAQEGKLWYLAGTLGSSGRIHGQSSPLFGERTGRGGHPTVAYDGDGRAIILYDELRHHGLKYVQCPMEAGRPVGKERPVGIAMERC